MTLQNKVILISILIFFAAMGGSTLVTTTYFADEYLAARKSEAFVIAQTLKTQLDRLIRMHIPLTELVGFEKLCQEAVSEHRVITFAMVVDLDGTILFHNDPALHGQKVRTASTLDALSAGVKRMQPAVINGEKYYEFFLPVSESGSQATAFIRIGFPRNHIAERTQRLALYSTCIAIAAFSIGCLLLVGMLKQWVGKPIARLTATITQIKEEGFIEPDRQVKVSSQDEMGHLAAAFNEMTDALQESTVSKAHVDYILEHMLNSLVITDSDGIIEFVNQETLNILGYRKDELVGKPFRTLLGPSDEWFEDTISGTSDSMKAIECFYRSKAGDTVPILFSSSPLPLKNNRAQGRICVAQDMTETKILRGMIPICASCKKIRDDKGYWNQVEAYIARHSQAKFSHGICPDCLSKLYPDLAEEKPALLENDTALIKKRDVH